MAEKNKYCIAALDYDFNHRDIIRAINKNTDINHDYRELSNGEILGTSDVIFFKNIRERKNNINFDSEILNSMNIDEMPMICRINEDNKSLTDIITGRTFSSHKCSPCSCDVSLDYQFTIDYNDVEKLIKSLSADEIKKYKKQIKKIERTASRTSTKIILIAAKNAFKKNDDKKLQKK